MKDDYGYFGKGLTGYVQYMRAHDRIYGGGSGGDGSGGKGSGGGWVRALLIFLILYVLYLFGEACG